MIDWAVLVPIVCTGVVSVLGAVSGLLKINQKHLEKILGPARESSTLREDFDTVVNRISSLETRQDQDVKDFARNSARLVKHARGIKQNSDEIKKNSEAIKQHRIHIDALEDATLS